MSDALSTTGFKVRRKSLTAATPLTITTSSIGPATLITTSLPHGLNDGDQVTIAGHTGSTPAIAGSFFVDMLTPTTFTIPLAVTVAGTGGTATPGFVEIAELRMAGPGGKSRNEIDTSIHNEGSESKQLGILRQKNPTLKINYVFAKASHVVLNSDIDNNVTAIWQFAAPSGFTRTGNARVQSFEYDDAPMDAIQAASITLCWAGIVVEAGV